MSDEDRKESHCLAKLQILQKITDCLNTFSGKKTYLNMAQIPEWFNRELIQMSLIVLVTLGIHYYFIIQRFQAGIDEEIAKMEAEEGIKQQ